MAEDEGANGDRWTEEACCLFTKAGWQKIADSNIDIEDTEGRDNGIDALFHYEDGFYPKMSQGVFIEAKRYKTTSFKKSLLNTWVLNLYAKITRLRNASKFHQTYPIANELNWVTGVIAIWFHDLENYQKIKETFEKALVEIKLPIGRKEKNLNFKIFVLDNEKIQRLASLLELVEKINKDGSQNDLKFYYPSSAGFGNSAQELPVINLEYIFSQFVFAKKREENSGNVTDIVFYFGELDMNSFERLKDAMLTYNMIHKQNDLVIYKYKREDATFRKIKPDVVRLFEETKVKGVKIEDITRIDGLPSWMKVDK